MSYEKEQSILQKLMDDIDFSDEEEAFSASESEYDTEKSESESSSDEDILSKRRKLITTPKNNKKGSIRKPVSFGTLLFR